MRIARTAASVALLVLALVLPSVRVDAAGADDPADPSPQARGGLADKAVSPGARAEQQIKELTEQQVAQPQTERRRAFVVRTAIGFNPDSEGKTGFNLSISGARTPVNVWVTNQTGKPQSTVIRVREVEHDELETLDQAFVRNIPPGGTARVTFVMRLSGDRGTKIAVDVEGSEGARESTLEPVILQDEGQGRAGLSVAVGDRQGEHAALSSSGPGSSVLHMPVDLLPEDAAAYEGVRCVLLHDVATLGPINPGAIQALEGFVLAGGDLIVENASGLDPHSPIARSLAPLLPVEISLVAKPWGLGALKPVLLRSPLRTSVLDFQPFPQATAPTTRLTMLRAHALAHAQGHPCWAASGSLGRGAVHYLGFCTEAKVAIPASETDLLGGMGIFVNGLVGSNQTTVRGSALFAQVVPSYDGARTVSAHAPGRRPIAEQREDDRAIELAIRSEDFRRLPTHHAVLFFLLAYALLAGPGLRLLGRAARRPLAGWAALPVLVAIFTVLAPTFLSIRAHFPDHPVSKRLGFIETSSRSPVALEHSILSLFSPANATYELTAVARGSAMHFDRLETGLTNRTLEGRRAECGFLEDGLDVINLSQNANSTSLHDLSGTLDLAGGIELRYVSLTQGAAQARDRLIVHNGSGMTLIDLVVFLDGKIVRRIERLPPGARTEVSAVDAEDASTARFLSFPETFFATNDRLIRQVTADMNAFSVGHGRAQPVLVARVDHSDGIAMGLGLQGKSEPLIDGPDGKQDVTYIAVWGEGADPDLLERGVVCPATDRASPGEGAAKDGDASKDQGTSKEQDR